MKKSTKALLAGLVVVPAALAMTACGGGAPNLVDTSGNYNASTAASYEEVNTVLTDPELSTEMDSYRMFIYSDVATEVKYSNEKLRDERAKGVGEIDCLAKIDPDNGLQMKVKMKESGGGENFEAEMYINQGSTYMQNPLTGSWEIQDGLGMSTTITEVDYESLFAGVDQAELEGASMYVDDSTDGVTKVKIVVDGSVLSGYGAAFDQIDAGAEWNDAEVYYIIKDGKLQGVKITMSGTMTMTMEDMLLPVDVMNPNSELVMTNMEIKVITNITVQLSAQDVNFDLPAGIVA